MHFAIFFGKGVLELVQCGYALLIDVVFFVGMVLHSFRVLLLFYVHTIRWTDDNIASDINRYRNDFEVADRHLSFSMQSVSKPTSPLSHKIIRLKSHREDTRIMKDKSI